MSSKQVKKKINLNYKDSGVATEAGHQLIKIIKPEVEKTRRAEILSRIGSFTALSALPKHIKNPVLVTCTDGVGTKVVIANMMKKYNKELLVRPSFLLITKIDTFMEKKEEISLPKNVISLKISSLSNVNISETINMMYRSLKP